MSHTEGNTEDAETLGELIMSPCPLPSRRATCLPFSSSSRDFSEHFGSKSGIFYTIELIPKPSLEMHCNDDEFRSFMEL